MGNIYESQHTAEEIERAVSRWRPTDHRELSHRNEANQHSMSSITGLVEEIAKIDSKLTEPSSGLAVGKYFRIASIDEDGHAVLEAVDAPYKEWTYIGKITTTEEITTTLTTLITFADQKYTEIRISLYSSANGVGEAALRVIPTVTNGAQDKTYQWNAGFPNGVRQTYRGTNVLYFSQKEALLWAGSVGSNDINAPTLTSANSCIGIYGEDKWWYDGEGWIKSIGIKSAAEGKSLAAGAIFKIWAR